MIVSQQLRVRALVIAASAVLVLAGCGGGGSSKPASPLSTNGGTEAATTTTASDAGGNGGGKCYTPPGKQKARVRFVNLYTNSTYPSGDIEVWQGYGPTDTCAKKLASIPFGQASDYIDVTATDESGNWSATAYAGSSAAKDHEIITQSETWKGGEQVTIAFEAGDVQPDSGLPPSSGGDQAFFEAGVTDDSSAFKAVTGKAALGIAATSLQYVDKEGAWVAGVVGTPTCLKAPGDTDSTRTNIGGTQLVQYSVAPGSTQLALYKAIPGKCAGPPAIGPVTINATAGSRTFVFAYGADAQHLKLLVLPLST